MTTLAAMRVVARHFNELGLAYTFLGAATLPLLVDDADILEIRPTLDIDLSVQVATLGEHYALEERLRGRGFRHDTREGAPICRWLAEGVTVDVMPTEGRVLSLASMWFEEAVKQAIRSDLADDVLAPVIPRPYCLATKLTAHADRGAKDPSWARIWKTLSCSLMAAVTPKLCFWTAQEVRGNSSFRPCDPTSQIRPSPMLWSETFDSIPFQGSVLASS